MFSLLKELIVFKPVNYNVNDLACFFLLDLLQRALEKVVDYCNFVGVLWLLKELHGKHRRVVLAESLNYLNLF